ncbi:MAG: N-carbamoyl-D-amino-acid hydrolase [Nitriliruptoraceae bacterium]
MTTRTMTVAAAQMGPVAVDDDRSATVMRLIDLLDEAADRGATLVNFTEVALTAFFSHWMIEDEDELDAWFETAMPSPTVQPLFDRARERSVAFCLGFSELARTHGVRQRFNSAVLVDRSGKSLGLYRKIHLPGFTEPQPGSPFENLEKRYYEVGNLGFPTFDVDGARVGMLICNDRRWPEAYRVLGLQGVEIVLIGYNTPFHNPAFSDTDRLAEFHNHLSMQAGAYQNATWVIGTAKAGTEAGVQQIGGSCIIAPSGEIVALAETDDDEVVVADIDLDMATAYKQHVFDLVKNRRVEHYGPLTFPGA